MAGAEQGWARKSKASGKARRLMSKPTLQQETKLHKDSGAGPSSGFLPSGPWSRIKLPIPAHPAFLYPPTLPAGGLLPFPHTSSPTRPLASLPGGGVGGGAHSLLRLRTQGPHPCRPEVEGEPSPLPTPPVPSTPTLELLGPSTSRRQAGRVWPSGESPWAVL